RSAEQRYELAPVAKHGEFLPYRLASLPTGIQSPEQRYWAVSRRLTAAERPASPWIIPDPVYVRFGSLATEDGKAKRRCTSASPQKQTNSGSSRYVRLVRACDAGCYFCALLKYRKSGGG